MVIPYDGPIEEGMRFVWRPDLDWERALIVVTRVQTFENDDTRIHTRILETRAASYVGREVWNEEDHFRASVVRDGDLTVCSSALPHDDSPPLRDELEALIKRWSQLAHKRAHNHEGADYQLGSAAGMRQCIDDLERLLKSDKST